MKKDRKIAFGVMLASLTLIASIVSTIAWFEGASYLEVNGFYITLHDKNIEISDDGEDFTDFIGSDETSNISEFSPISSAFSDEWIAEKSPMPKFANSYTSKAAATSGLSIDNPNMGFYCGQFYIKSDSDVNITLNAEKTSFLGDHQYNSEHFEEAKNNNPLLLGMSDEEIIAELDRVCESLRMSILVLNDYGIEEDDPHYFDDYAYYVIDPYKKETTYFGGLLDINEDSFYDYGEDNKEILYGELENEDKIVYDEPALENGDLVGKNTCFNARTCQGVEHVNIEKSQQNGLKIAKEKSYTLEECFDNVLIPISKARPKRMVISLYLEGWDRDNTNFARYAGFIINVCFMIAQTR